MTVTTSTNKLAVLLTGILLGSLLGWGAQTPHAGAQHTTVERITRALDKIATELERTRRIEERHYRQCH